MKRRDLIRKLEKAGYILLRDKGDHTVYYKKGLPLVEIPRHKEVNEITARGILKSARLK